MDRKAKFFCESCGAEVRQNDKFCRVCGKFFSSVKCPACGKTGSPALFSAGCPACGYAINLQNIQEQNIVTGKKTEDEYRIVRTKKNMGNDTLPVWIYISCVLLVIILFLAIILYFH